ncbi:integrase arm-type DNA-binding domain-containing protein [Comamonas piscis]|uniref:Integrase arm-type DNA-binding domain-containing protein n=1 Tax=Comamonas piscis TaxID=1562974 RepID=A0A7G5ELW5_9BURK|nr:site-specific integrase [Comamonas piscis]QMV74990.1 integrase arm-type DNA-binding domain-containing protein [Comamonas piscis]WSO33470.1 integrase arm-type DNA-binding domain-containing protein [Comamonas piscis]
MPKRILEKTALEVSRLREEGAYAVGGVSGLYLQIVAGSRVWVYRYMHHGMRRRMGLGSYPAVTLAAARESARAAMGLRDSGTDPLHARAAEREAARLAAAQKMPFAQAAELFIREHESTWRNLKHAQQWRNTLDTYAFPVLGQVNVGDVEQQHVLRALAPIWKTKTETATRLRGRIEQILDWSTAHGHRTGPNPARWRGQLQHILADPNKVAPVQHHPAVAYADLPGFYQRLCSIKGESARALQLLILTAARSGEVRGMRWGEFDKATGIWLVPADRMKSKRPHRVPLPAQALALLEQQEAGDSDDYVFKSNRAGMLSDMALTALMRRHYPSAVPHGFRSTFRDWAGECTHHPRDAIELCLAHSIDTKTEAAYRRGDMLEKRTVIMQEWADYAAPAQLSL